MSIRNEFGLPRPQGVILCTSTTHPANPYVGMRIYETDTGNELTYQSATTGFTPPWNTAWGVLGYVQVTANQGSITGATDLTSLTLTTTFIANRRIQLKGNVLLQDTVGTDQIFCQITDATPTLVQQANGDPNAANQNVTVQPEIILSPAAGLKLYKLRAGRVGSGIVTMAAGATFPAWFSVVDLGSNGAPA